MIDHLPALVIGLTVGLGIGVTLGGGAYTRGRIEGACGLARHLLAHGWLPPGAIRCGDRWIRLQESIGTTWTDDALDGHRVPDQGGKIATADSTPPRCP